MENQTICLRTDFSLGPHQEEDVLVFLEGEWREDTLVSQHPSFDQPNIKVVGEVGEGGDHMYVSFKNLSAQPVTIKENTKIVQLHPRNQRISSAHQDGKRMTREADDTAGGTPLGIHGVSVTGILVT